MYLHVEPVRLVSAVNTIHSENLIGVNLSDWHLNANR